MEEDSDKRIDNFSDLALEISLLYSELNCLEELPIERLENLRGFCVEASKQFMLAERPYFRRVA